MKSIALIKANLYQSFPATFKKTNPAVDGAHFFWVNLFLLKRLNGLWLN